MHSRKYFLKNLSIATAGLVCLPSFYTGEKIYDVIIIGGGISGLYAAHLLQKKGARVKLLEASERTGGRLYTKQLTDGTHIDLGGIEVGNGYKRILSLADELGVMTVNAPASQPPESYIYYKGMAVTSAAWPAYKENPLPAPFASYMPWQAEAVLLAKDNPLTSLTAWAAPEFAALDYPFANYCRNKGMNDAALDMINHGANYNDINSISCLHLLRSAAYRKSGGSTGVVYFKNGSQSFTDAMAQKTANIISFNSPVKEVSCSANTYNIITTSGKKFRSKSVISTTPLHVYRQMVLPKNIKEKISLAASEIQYTQIQKFIFKPMNKFWEKDGLPVNMWTDEIIERVMSVKNEDGNIAQLIVWVNGKGCGNFNNLSEAERVNMVLKTFYRIRPAATGNLELIAQHNWQDGLFNGAYAEFQAGQIKEYAAAISEPVENFHFAGEHTAWQHRGMEGAAESAERAVKEI